MADDHLEDRATHTNTNGTSNGLAPTGHAGGRSVVPPRKQRYTLHLSSDLIERLRNAVYWTPGLTLAGLAEDALRERMDQMEDTRGEPFPTRNGELKPGRPLRSSSAHS